MCLAFVCFGVNSCIGSISAQGQEVSFVFLSKYAFKNSLY